MGTVIATIVTIIAILITARVKTASAIMAVDLTVLVEIAIQAILGGLTNLFGEGGAW